jgi:hypothetical protein
MSLGHGANLVRDGLILCLDAANVKSYSGSGASWTDITGNGNNATLVNIPTYATTNSGILSFNGTDEYANGTLPVFSVGASATIEAMVRLTDVTNLSAIFSHGRSGVSFNMGMVVSVSDLKFRNSTNDHTLSSPTIPINSGQWYHLVLSITPSLTTGYINSISQGTTNQVITTNAITDYHISRRSSIGSTEYVNGSIGLVRVYNRALSIQEIQRNFNGLRGRYGI